MAPVGARRYCRWAAASAELLLLWLFASATCASAAPGTAPETTRAAAPGGATDAAASPALINEAPDAMASVGGTDLYLEVSVNGRGSGLAHFVYRDGELWATLATLRQLSFALSAGTPDPVRLGSLSRVQVSYDPIQQSVAIVAPLELLSIGTHVLDTRQIVAPTASSTPGVLLNYNLFGTHNTGDAGSLLSAYTELRAFGNNSVLSSTALSQLADSTDDAWSSHSVMLDTEWSRSFPDQMLTFNAGDTLTAATSWSRSTRIGGLQFGTNFALQPYQVTTPLPQFFGQATLPSQLDLYINGLKQYSGNVPAGPFQLNTVPGINGSGFGQIVLTDALGRVTSLDFPIYQTDQLLRAGLADWSAELGVVRENYGVQSFDYGHDLMGSATWRYGVNDSFTAEAHAETTNSLAEGGAGGDWLLGQAGVLSAAWAGSTNQGSTGAQTSLGYDWTDSRFYVGLNGQRATAGYRDVASLYGLPPPTWSASAHGGYTTNLIGTMGVMYVYLHYPQQAVSSYASVYWFRSFDRRVSASFNVNQNLSEPRDRSVFFDLTVSFDERTHLSADVQHDDGRNLYTLNAIRTIPYAGGLGWRVEGEQGAGGVNGALGELDYLGRYGQVQAGFSSLGSNEYTYAGAIGSLVLLDGHGFAARQIYNGFAVVSTDGIPDVPVKLENNLIGTTDADGLLLVTPLNAYQNNKLSIDPLVLPADVRVERVDATAAPTDRAGTLVRFPITRIRAASIILVDATGRPLPLGSEVRIHGRTGEPALVGFDGVVYLETLEAHNLLDVLTPAGPCHVRFDFKKQDESIPQIGPLACTEAAQ